MKDAIRCKGSSHVQFFGLGVLSKHFYYKKPQNGISLPKFQSVYDNIIVLQLYLKQHVLSYIVEQFGLLHFCSLHSFLKNFYEFCKLYNQHGWLKRPLFLNYTFIGLNWRIWNFIIFRHKNYLCINHNFYYSPFIRVVKANCKLCKSVFC